MMCTEVWIAFTIPDVTDLLREEPLFGSHLFVHIVLEYHEFFCIQSAQLGNVHFMVGRSSETNKDLVSGLRDLLSQSIRRF